MPATEPSKSDRLKQGLARVRALLTAHGRAFTPNDAQPLHELHESFDNAIAHSISTIGGVKINGSISPEDLTSLAHDIVLFKEIFFVVYMQCPEN